MLKKIFKKSCIMFLKDLLIYSSIMFLCATIIITPKISALGVKIGLNFCSNTLIPSLFPFMVLSSFIVKSGIAENIGCLLEPITKFIFKLPGCTATTILMGLIGGYPSGAIGVNELYQQKKISRKQAEQMLCFTVGAGPAFVFGAVCSQLSHNYLIGIIIFSSQILSSLILGIFIGLYSHNNVDNLKSQITFTNKSFSCALVESCLESAKSMFNMCAFVILFSALLNIIKESSAINTILNFLSYFNINPQIQKCIFPIILEVTNGCMAIINNYAPTELISFMLGWAGICVHLQIFSITQSINFSKLKFILFRFLHAVLSTIISHFLFITLGTKTSIATIKLILSSEKSDCYFSKGSIALILLCIYFLFTITPKKLERKKYGWRNKCEQHKKRKLKKAFRK